MRFSESRRQFLRSFLPEMNGSLESLLRIDDIVNGAVPRIHHEKTLRRRDFLKAVAGLAGIVVPFVFPLDEAESEDRPPSLIGTPESLAKQGEMFKQDSLSMLYEKDLKPNSFYRRDKRLVAVRNTPHYYLNNVEFGNAVTRPYVSLFLQRLSEQFYNKFQDRLRVTDLTRSVEYQNYLRTGKMPGRPDRKPNYNATSPEKSSHVRGAAIDISYALMNSKQKQWMRDTLVDLENADYIEATEERSKKQPHFHIMVFKNYIGYVQKRLGMNDREFAKYYERVTGGRIY